MTDDLYTSFRNLNPKVTGGLFRMREDTFKNASVPAKYKILAALVAVVVTKCEPCLRAYTKMAFQAGATQDELVEFLNVAITEGGCPVSFWRSASVPPLFRFAKDLFNRFMICLLNEELLRRDGSLVFWRFPYRIRLWLCHHCRHSREWLPDEPRVFRQRS